MSKICQLTGTKPLVGNHVSHSKHRTLRRFSPNLQDKRIYVSEIDKWVKVKLTTRALRTMEKMGAFQYFKQQIALGFDPQVWVIDEKELTTEANKRGYRRVENVDKNGTKTYSVTYEPLSLKKGKVKLSSVIK